MTFSIQILLIFLIFNIVWLQIPGMFFVRILLPHRLKTASRLLAGYFMGFVVLAALYYIESATGLNGIIMAAGPILSLIAIFYWIKVGKPRLLNAGEEFRASHIIVFAALYIISTLAFQLKYLGALSGNTTQVYHDFLFHTGNIASLSQSFPNYDYRVSGLVFYYHYFFELIFAMAKHIFKMDAFRLYMTGNALIVAWPLTLAVTIVADRLKGNRICSRNKYFFYMTGLFVSCMCLLPLNVVGGTFPISWMDNHLFTNGNAMGLAVSLNVLMIDLLVEVWYDGFRKTTTLALFILMIATTGFKGTTGAMIVAITWAVFIIELIVSRDFCKQKLYYTLSMTAGFALTYIFVVKGLSSSGSNNRATTFSPSGTLESSRVGQVFEKILGLDYMSFPWIIIAILLCIVCIVGPIILVYIAFTVHKCKPLFKEKEIGDIFDWFAIGQVLMGVVAFVSISVPGLSQGYLVISGTPFIFYCAIRYLQANECSILKKYMYVFWAFGTIFLMADIANYVKDDLQQNALFLEEAGDADDKVSSETMEAYLWLKDNTAEDAVVAVDRVTENLDYRDIYFYCSAFAERQCYIEGYDYSDIPDEQSAAMLEINETFYSSENAVAEAAMGLQGIDYLVVTEHSHPGYSTSSTRLQLVFSNDEVQIYKFNSK